MTRSKVRHSILIFSYATILRYGASSRSVFLHFVKEAGIADEGYDPEFGARPVKRVIHRLVLNRLSKDILAQKVDRSRPIIIDVDDAGELVFSN